MHLKVWDREPALRVVVSDVCGSPSQTCTGPFYVLGLLIFFPWVISILLLQAPTADWSQHPQLATFRRKSELLGMALASLASPLA